ncbi:integrase catalytic domain-containing protein [Trichonephila clavipes]|nr:integrase catalytic domain-containing protein [Trichonephila clavipes]
MSSFLVLCEGNTRNRWRDGQVCPDVDKELWRLGPDGSGVFWRVMRKSDEGGQERLLEKKRKVGRGGRGDPGERTDERSEEEDEKSPGERTDGEEKTGETEKRAESGNWRKKDDERRWRAPWWCGFWERFIGLLKRILRKVLGRTSFDYQEIETVLCDCESLLNSRHLTYVSDEPNYLCPLTPDLFLKEIRNSSTRDLDIIKFPDKTELNKRLAYRRRLVNDLRVRFCNEYLRQLLQKMKFRTQKYVPEIGHIVLISNESLKRIDWHLGRILLIYTSVDGIVRRAKVKTLSGVVVRPIQMLCPLELDVWQVVNKSRETIDLGGNSERLDCAPTIPDYVPIVPDSVSTVPDSDVRTTRSGRNIRTPNRYRT